MDQYTENRFGHFRELSDNALIAKRDELQEEVDSCYEGLNDESISSAQKSEIRNSDLPYAEQQLEYVQALIKERGLAPTL